MNLLNEKWLTVRRTNGEVEKIAPWEITCNSADPLVSLTTPRPDFNGPLVQFLIGLLQTAAAPEDQDVWWEWFDSPPTPDTLREKFSAVANAFELYGEWPRFMQDLELRDSEAKPISGLLIDAPGGNTLKNNQDHFVKRDTVSQLCPVCTATALFALQTNAPSGGVGHRVSLRGGGPLTTLVMGESLWQTIWLNVLPQDEFLSSSGNSKRQNPVDIFPWLGPTRTSEATSHHKLTTPDDAHPTQMFWGMPRRIRLDFGQTTTGSCDVCGAQGDSLLTQYQTKNYGVSYEGWQHVLTPHTRDKTGLPMPRHAQPGGVNYRHWLGLVQAVKDERTNREPARVVDTFIQERRRDSGLDYRLWAFGYDMDNMKARCWYEATMPLILVKDHYKEEFEYDIRSMVMAANEVAGNLKQCMKNALYGRVKEISKKRVPVWEVSPNAKTDGTLFNSVSTMFWQRTEPAFLDVLRKLKTTLERGEGTESARRDWHAELCKKARMLFDETVDGGVLEDGNPQSVVVARAELNRFNYGKNIVTDLLRLPAKEKNETNIPETGEMNA